MNTVQSHAYSLTNIGGIMTTLYCLMRCRKVERIDLVGTLIIGAACLLIVFDPSAFKIGQVVKPLYSVLSILPSIPNALYFNYSKTLQKEVGM